MSAQTQLDNLRTRQRLMRQSFSLDIADVGGAGLGIALGATLLKGMQLGPIPVKVNTVLGLLGLYLLFTSPPPRIGSFGESAGRKFLTSFCLGAGAERVFAVSEERLANLFSGLLPKAA